MSRPISDLVFFQLGFVAAEFQESARLSRRQRGADAEDARVLVECSKELSNVRLGECLMKQLAALQQKWAAKFGSAGISDDAGLAYSTAADRLTELGREAREAAAKRRNEE